MVVLPVPGPPVSTVVNCDNAISAAARCSCEPGRWNTRSSPAAIAAASTGGSAAEAAEQVGAHLLLLAPVPVQVQQPVAIQAQHRRRRQQWAGPQRRDPLVGARPGQLRQARIRLHGSQIQAHRPVADRAHRQRHRQRDRLVGRLPRGRRQDGHPGRDVHVGGLQHTGFVEGAQQPTGAERQPPVSRIADLRHLRCLRDRHAPLLGSAAIQQVRQRGHQGGRRQPAEHPGRMTVDRRACPARTSRARTDTARRRNAAPVRNRAAATAEIDAAQPNTAAPAAGSRSAASPGRAAACRSRRRS